MSFVASAIGIASTIGGKLIEGKGGSGGADPFAPAGPVTSGVGDTSFVFGAKPAKSPAWVLPLVIGLLTVVTLGLVFLILPSARKNKK